MTTALLTDHYELTMLQAALAAGTAERRCVFELFGRRLTGERRYGVVAGVDRAIEAVRDFTFGPAEIDFLRSSKVVDERTLEYLSTYRFTGDIWGYPEGELYFPNSPIMIVEGTFAEACMLETVLLSVLNHDSAVATAGSRMITAAEERPCIEMGSRRTHEEAAVAAARAAYVVGFGSTSNLEAGRRYGVPTRGTAAHSFTLLHDSERDAFTAQVESLGKGTVLLVDTYDVHEAVKLAIEVAGPELGGVRLDSGDLVALAREVRAELDALGATSTKITVTSDLDEFAIAALAAAPVDGYGVGTSLVTGSGVPTAGMVYKLVSRTNDAGEWVDVAKKATNKTSVGGRKYALRRLDARGVAEAEVIGIGEVPENDGNDRELLVQLVKGGAIVSSSTLDEARARHEASLAEMPPKARRLSRGEPAIPTIWLDEQKQG